MKFAVTVTLVSGLLLAPGAFAQNTATASNPDDAIQYRQGVMDTIRANAEAIGAILQGKVPQQATLAEHARVLATATTWLPAAFEQNTDGLGKEKTKAKAGIWTDKAKFASHAKDAQAAAQKLSMAANSGDMAAVGASFKPLLKTCKSCHDDFKSK